MDPNPSYKRGHRFRPHSDCNTVCGPFSEWERIYVEVRFNYRIYAITGKNKLIGVTLAFVVGTELCYGIFAVTWIGLGPCESFNGSSIRVSAYVPP